MRSRYCAFYLQNPKYIIKTTHKENPDYTLDTQKWENDILSFCQTCDFKALKVLEFIDGDHEAFVTFEAKIFCKDDDCSFIEKSRFFKVDNMWLYHSGEFL